jgi:hypothetical protein
MIAAVNHSSRIVPSVVPDDQRSAILPKKFPGMFLLFEANVYHYLHIFSDDYKSGYWEFVELSNGGFYMSLRSRSRYYLTISSNGYEGEMSADAASLVANLYTLCALANQHQLDYLIEMYHALREYACEHPEADRILQAID